MKRLFCLFLILVLLFGVSGCSEAEVTREQIVEAYEAAGYTVSTKVYEEPQEYGEIAYIQANHPDGDYIYFSVFENSRDAKAYKDTYYHPLTMGLFSLIYGQPSWIRWKVHGCIVAQYSDPNLYAPFSRLLQGN